MVIRSVICSCSCPLTGDLTHSACVCGCVINGVSTTAATRVNFIIIDPIPRILGMRISVRMESVSLTSMVFSTVSCMARPE